MHIDKIFTQGNQLYRQDARGDLYVWVATPGLGEFGGLWKKIKKTAKKIHKTAVKIIKAPIRLHQKVQRKVLKSKFGRAIVTGAGAVFAPFTGGTSLAAAQALTRYGKARYGQGLSRSEAMRAGVKGAAIGYVAGVGLVYGAGQLGIGRAAQAGLKPSFFTPFGTSATHLTQAAAPIVSGGSPASSMYANAYSGLTQATTASAAAGAAAPASLFSKIVAGAVSFGKAALPIALQLQSKAAGGSGTSGEFDPGMMASGVPYNGAYSDSYGGGSGSGGGGGGPNMPPEFDPETGEEIVKPQLSPVMLAAALGGLVLFTTMGGGRRSRKKRRSR